ncbi:MAG: SDR family NAD(P)-dependent oxidoreductase [Candidatus Hadarchaeales archaeon]
MKVLVTGGAGFIGSHVVDLLMSMGHHVAVLDNMSNGKTENLRKHLHETRFRLVKGDVRNRKTVEECVDGVDWVVHEAAIVSVQQSIEKPEFVKDVNFRGTEVVLQTCADFKVGRVVFASSCAIYGGQKKLPIKEDAEPDPISPYARSKLDAERLCLDFHKKGLSTVCLRYFNVYGPRQSGGDYAGVMVKFIERLKSGLPPQIFGDGEQTRDFVHVSDVARATVLALEEEKAGGEVINVGTGKEISINELCRIFFEVSGQDMVPVHLPARPGEVRRSCADMKKAKKLLGFVPKVDIRRGVKSLWGERGRS